MEQLLTCPKCQNSNNVTDFFCRICGHKLKEKPLSTSLLKQLSVYLISLLVPPFGLIPAVKYLRQDESKSKQIGVIAIIITIVSVIISITLLSRSMNALSEILNGETDLYEDFSF